MKKNIFLTLAILTIMAIGVYAQSERDFEQQLISNGIEITRYRGNASTIIIPEKIDNMLPVTSIGYAAFQNNIYITSVTIPNFVFIIGERAFNRCARLTTVNMSNNVVSIGALAFHLCGFTSITIPDSVKIIGTGAFGGCASLTNITIPASVKRIEMIAFNGCDNLIKVTFQGIITSDNLEDMGGTMQIFPGDLREKYLAGGIGTYTRESGSYTWKKQP